MQVLSRIFCSKILLIYNAFSLLIKVFSLLTASIRVDGRHHSRKLSRAFA